MPYPSSVMFMMLKKLPSMWLLILFCDQRSFDGFLREGELAYGFNDAESGKACLEWTQEVFSKD